MKLLFITGSRGEWGYISPIIEKCKKKSIELEILATNMHLLPQHGMTIDEILNSGNEVKYKIYSTFDGANHATMAKSIGSFVMSMVDVIEVSKPDWIILAGDRSETVGAAIAGSYTYTPTAHIQAGELSGNIDGIGRHVIGKLSHLHLASNKDAYDRLLKLGEEEFRIHNVGAPQLDDLYDNNISDKKVLSNKYEVNLDEDYFLVIFHPVTEEYDDMERQISSLYNSLKKYGQRKIWILPNNDAGSSYISNYLMQNRDESFSLFQNLPREDYLGLMSKSQCMIGNSSSGILESPTYAIPTVNIGSRQEGRVRSPNIIDLDDFDEKSIVAKIEIALSQEFNNGLENISNPYGDGKSSDRILEILEKMISHDSLLNKRITF